MKIGARRGEVSALLATAVWMLVGATPALAAPECTASDQRPRGRMETTLGDIEILLCSVDVPATVSNFLQYVDEGAYTTTGFIHRSVQEDIFIVQGGGFFVANETFIDSVTTRPPIDLELVGLENRRGTIAMARLGGDENSATSQWFINAQDNLQFDTGYAVFGEVTQGMDVVDAMASQGIWSLNPGVLAEVPLVDYPDDGSSYLPYLVSVTDVINLPEPRAAIQGLAAVLSVAGVVSIRRRRGR